MLVYIQMLDSPEEKALFECLYLKYRDLMFYIANQILQNRQDAEDAVHAAFVAVAEHMDKISCVDCPQTKGYIVTITENKAIDLYRQKKRHPQTLYLEETEGLTISYEGKLAIAGCFAKLPGRYRDILLQRYRYGYTVKEISKMLHITEANAKKRILRAKEKLERFCKEEGLL